MGNEKQNPRKLQIQSSVLKLKVKAEMQTYLIAIHGHGLALA